jgi:hypothetical protein
MMRERGELERAVAAGGECVSLARELGDARTLLYGFGTLAVLAAADGDAVRAGRLWGAVETLEARGEAKMDADERGQVSQGGLRARRRRARNRNRRGPSDRGRGRDRVRARAAVGRLTSQSAVKWTRRTPVEPGQVRDLDEAHGRAPLRSS